MKWFPRNLCGLSFYDFQADNDVATGCTAAVSMNVVGTMIPGRCTDNVPLGLRSVMRSVHVVKLETLAE